MVRNCLDDKMWYFGGSDMWNAGDGSSVTDWVDSDGDKISLGDVHVSLKDKDQGTLGIPDG